jgi:putative transposase
MVERRGVITYTREERWCFHRQANALAALPKSAHSGALAAMREVVNARRHRPGQVTVKAFEIDYAAQYPRAVADRVHLRHRALAEQGQ